MDRAILAVVLFIPRVSALFASAGGDPLSRAVLFKFSWTDIFLWAASCAYFVLLTWFAGGTLGKLAMGLRVTDRNGERPTFVTVLCRETYARYLSSILLIGYFLAIADPKNGALHDRICDTQVTPVEAAPETPGPQQPRLIREMTDPVAQWYEPYRK